MCYSDVTMLDVIFSLLTPVVLVHEGAGDVEAVGRNVTRAGLGGQTNIWEAHDGHCGQDLTGNALWCENGAPSAVTYARTGLSGPGVERASQVERITIANKHRRLAGGEVLLPEVDHRGVGRDADAVCIKHEHPEHDAWRQGIGRGDPGSIDLGDTPSHSTELR